MSVIPLTLDDAIIEDYTASFSAHYTNISNCVDRLNRAPDDENVINEVFRSLHTIKGNADMCQFDAITHFTHALEDLVAEIREGDLRYEATIGEIILLCLDKTKELGEMIFSNFPIKQQQLDQIMQQLKSISQQPANIEQIAGNIAQLISGHIVDGGSEQLIGKETAAKPASAFTQNKVTELLPCPYSQQAISDDDLDFLRGLKAWSVLMEQKIPFWHGRLERTLPMTIEMNKQLPQPVDMIQLEAALYVHDVSFAFLNNHLLQKDGKFDARDSKEMQQHPLLSSNLLKHVSGWETAAMIVAQHHEKWDGSGYPYQLSKDEIHLGAQILAVVDAYESMTSVRADRHYKRSILRAITEINNCSGSQFNPEIVLIFNALIREKVKQR